MAIVIKAKENERIDSLLRRFKYAVEQDGILNELEERRYFRKPAVVRQDERKKLRQKIKDQNRRKIS